MRECEEMARRLQAVVDGEAVSPEERVALERHVEACAPCTADAETIRSLKEAIARVASRPDPAVRARLGELLDELRCGNLPEGRDDD